MADNGTLVTALTALSASFAGAWFAFLFESRRRRKAEEATNARNGNRALYTIYDYWNAAKSYYDEILQPFEDKPDAWLNIPASTNRFMRPPSLHDVDLSFMLGTPQSTIYAEVYLQEHRYASMKDLIARRDRLLFQKVFPVLPRGVQLEEEAAIEAVGHDTVHIAQRMTEGIIRNTKQNIDSFVESYSNLRGALTELYPKHRFINVRFHLDEPNDP